MSEKKLFCLMSIEGLLLLILGFCILILPKLTPLSFNVMVSSSLIVYGIYRFVASIINNNRFYNIFCEIVLGVYITVIGILLLCVPNINILWLIALIGVYLILDSMQTFVFAEKIKNTFKLWNCKFFSATLIFIAGIAILISLPDMEFITVSILTGIYFVLKGTVKRTLYLVNHNNFIDKENNA